MFKKLTEDAILPQRATRFSAGFDVFANENATIGAGETKLIGLGIALDDNAELNVKGKNHKLKYLQDIGLYLALHIRSSLRAKGLTSLGTGIIDMDYRDEIKMVVHNPLKYGSVPVNGSPDYVTTGVLVHYKYEIKKGDKIGQLILCRHDGWLLPSEYTKDEERVGGFGSTGETA